jgi:hypothetical protein
MLFLTEESGLHNEVMWNIFELVLKGKTKKIKVDRDRKGEGALPSLSC